MDQLNMPAGIGPATGAMLTVELPWLKLICAELVNAPNTTPKATVRATKRSAAKRSAAEERTEKEIRDNGDDDFETGLLRLRQANINKPFVTPTFLLN